MNLPSLFKTALEDLIKQRYWRVVRSGPFWSLMEDHQGEVVAIATMMRSYDDTSDQPVLQGVAVHEFSPDAVHCLVLRLRGDAVIETPFSVLEHHGMEGEPPHFRLELCRADGRFTDQYHVPEGSHDPY
jgi:hypothetical protein